MKTLPSYSDLDNIVVGEFATKCVGRMVHPTIVKIHSIEGHCVFYHNTVNGEIVGERYMATISTTHQFQKCQPIDYYVSNEMLMPIHQSEI